MKIDFKNWVIILIISIVLATISSFVSVKISSGNLRNSIDAKFVQNVQVADTENIMQEDIVKDTYKDFLMHYYENQSDWLNTWLTAMGVLMAVATIGVPLLLNASYQSKIEEMEREFKRKKEAMGNLQNNLNDKALSFEKTIEEAKDTISKIQNDYGSKLESFSEKVQEAILKGETDSILSRLEILEEEAKRHGDKRETGEEFEKLNLLIKLGENSLSKYAQYKSFCFSISENLASAYYSRGLCHYYSFKSNKKAIKDFEKSQKLRNYIDPTIQRLLLECFIIEKQYKKGLEIIKNIDKINKEKLNDKYLKLLKEADDETATALYQRLQEIIVE